jgi:hypothetical protein
MSLSNSAGLSCGSLFHEEFTGGVSSCKEMCWIWRNQKCLHKFWLTRATKNLAQRPQRCLFFFSIFFFFWCVCHVSFWVFFVVFVAVNILNVRIFKTVIQFTRTFAERKISQHTQRICVHFFPDVRTFPNLLSCMIIGFQNRWSMSHVAAG